MAYAIAGGGFPLVLHTGAGGDSRMWGDAGYVDGFASYRVVLLDHCGHGASDVAHSPAAYTPTSYADDVLALADELGLDRFFFGGYSNGARVGYELAANAPARVAALLAIGGVDAPVPDPEADRAAARAVRADGIAAILDDEPAPEWLLEQLADTDPEVVARELEGFAGWSPWPLFPRISAPTLIVAGEHESAYVEEAAAAIPQGSAAILPGVGHLGAFARSDLVLPLAQPFLGTAVD